MGGTQRSNVRNARGDQLSQIFSVTFQRKHKKQRLSCKIKKIETSFKGNSSGEKGKLETTRTEGLFKYGYPAYLPLSFELYHKG